MTTPLAFIDTETTGLHPELHEVWEVGMIVRSPDGSEVSYLWQLPTSRMGEADPFALDIGRYWERRWRLDDDMDSTDANWIIKRTHQPDPLRVPEQVPGLYLDRWCEHFAELTRGAHLVGATPSFDAERLGRLLRENNAVPGWSHHLVDVEALAAGWLAYLDSTGDLEHVAWSYVDSAAPPWKSENLSLAVGVDPKQFDRHTALGDAQWVAAIYDAIVTKSAGDADAVVDAGANQT